MKLLENFVSITASGLVAGAMVLTGLVLKDSSYVGIEVHHIKYDPKHGTITQDRSVFGKGPVIAEWYGFILDSRTGRSVCSGRGYWKYTLGRDAPPMTLAVWTGDGECETKLDPLKYYQPCATYLWADSQRETQCGRGFFPRKDRK